MTNFLFEKSRVRNIIAHCVHTDSYVNFPFYNNPYFK